MSSNDRLPGAPDGGAPVAAPHGLGGFEERLLAELKVAVAQQAAEAGATPDHLILGRAAAAECESSGGQTSASRRAGDSGRGPRPGRRLALTGAVSASLAVGLAIAVTFAVGIPAASHPGSSRPAAAGAPTLPGNRPPGHRASFAPAATAAAVLHNAALAALEMPAATPRPDQFIYLKLSTKVDGWPRGRVLQSWLSVDGARLGFEKGWGGPAGEVGEGRVNDVVPACRHGWEDDPPWFRWFKHRYPCTADTYAAYFPGMPTSPSALRAYMHTHFGLDLGDAGGLSVTAFWLMTRHYLMPAQSAAMYDVLAQAAGFKLVPSVTDAAGRTGVGIRVATGGKYYGNTLIFDRTTYAPLGMRWPATRLAPPGHKEHLVPGRSVAVLKVAIVNKAGQLP